MFSTDENNDDFASGGADLVPALPEPQTGGVESREVEFSDEDYKTAVRLLVGALLEGSDELRYRLKNWLTNVRRDEQAIEALNLAAETGGSALVYAMIGLLFESPRYLSRVSRTAGRAASVAASFTSLLARPITSSRVFRPVRRRYDNFIAGGESTVRSLEDLGRAEASPSRVLIREQMREEAVQDVLVYMVEKSKMREMIIETSTEVGGDALTEVRARTASVDSSLDSIVDSILRRRKLKAPPSETAAGSAGSGDQAP